MTSVTVLPVGTERRCQAGPVARAHRATQPWSAEAPKPVWLSHPGDLVLTPVTVPYEVPTEQASPRVLAAVRATTAPQRLSAEIIGLLDDDKRSRADALSPGPGWLRGSPPVGGGAAWRP
jgi:hypothetical protein